MDIAAILAEKKIREAIERGELDGLPGEGHPLELEDLSMVPEELRVCYMIMKNSGLLPPELELRKEILSIEAMLDSIDDERLLKKTVRILNEKILRLNIIQRKSLPLEKKQYYAESLRKKLKIPSPQGCCGTGAG